MPCLPPPRRLALSLVLGLGLGLSGTLPAAATPIDPATVSLDEARLDPEKLEQTAAAALRRSVQSLGDGRDVEVELVDLRVLPDAPASLALDGVGRLRVAKGSWIPVRLDASYDLAQDDLFGLRVLPLTQRVSTAARTLETGYEQRVSDQVAVRILSEFPDQPAQVVFVDVRPTAVGQGHVSFQGTGLVDFAQEGSAPVSFAAVLDRGSGLVVALDYQFEIVGAHGQGEGQGQGIVAAR